MKRSVTPVDVAMGKRLRALRVAAGYSQSVVGNILGVTFQQVQKYENGTNRVSAGKLKLMADMYHVTMSEMFAQPEAGDNGGDPDITFLRDGIDTLQLSKLAQLFKRLTSRQRQAVMEVVRSMVPDEPHEPH
jgi:transcriptional regulator with XRE-family HTH domain